MARTASTGVDLAELLRFTIVAVCRQDQPDLTAPQMSVFLTCNLVEKPHTVRGLAADLNVSKPPITRALDRLGEFDLVRRKLNPNDRRSVFATRTQAGAKYLRALEEIMREAAGMGRRVASKAG